MSEFAVDATAAPDASDAALARGLPRETPTQPMKNAELTHSTPHADSPMSHDSYGERLREAMGDQLVISAGVDAIVRNERGEILLIRRSDNGSWDLPGGAIEPGE